MSQNNPTKVQVNKYAENYVLYGDQSRAWRVAFPESKCKAETVHAKASAFYKHDKVLVRVAELQKTLKKQSQEEFTLSVSKLKQMLATAISKGLKDKVDQQGNTIAVNISAAVSAIGEINKMDGNHAATKTDLLSSDGSMTPKGFNDFYSQPESES